MNKGLNNVIKSNKQTIDLLQGQIKLLNKQNNKLEEDKHDYGCYFM